MSDTPRYHLPEPGTTDWHKPLNENFADLAVDMQTAEAAVDRLGTQKTTATEVADALTGKADVGHTHEHETITPRSLSGAVVDREQPISSLPGNIYLTPAESPDPTRHDGDLVFYAGEPGDITLSVGTDPVSDVTATTATLNGALTQLTGANTATVWFEYRQQGVVEWSSTPTMTLDHTTTFYAPLSNLTTGATYEVQAQASAGSGEFATTSTGSVVTFTPA